MSGLKNNSSPCLDVVHTCQVLVVKSPSVLHVVDLVGTPIDQLDFELLAALQSLYQGNNTENIVVLQVLSKHFVFRRVVR